MGDSPASQAATRPTSSLPSDWKNSATQDEIPEVVDRVAAAAGDAIIFTEACAHGTVPWQGANERRTIFYKYCPHAVAWSPCYYNADNYGALTDTQRAMLMPPSAYGPDERTSAIWGRAPSGAGRACAIAGGRRRPKRVDVSL